MLCSLDIQGAALDSLEVTKIILMDDSNAALFP
jgi:hypothetical protein